MFKAMFYLLIHRTLLRRTDNGAGPEGLGRKTFKIETQYMPVQQYHNSKRTRVLLLGFKNYVLIAGITGSD
jgi:hypothetical protein